jgi:hypothetical protein
MAPVIVPTGSNPMQPLQRMERMAEDERTRFDANQNGW